VGDGADEGGDVIDIDRPLELANLRLRIGTLTETILACSADHNTAGVTKAVMELEEIHEEMFETIEAKR
jgi:hypothetical protein